MNILITLLTIIDVLVALLIIALVLVQQSKSGGGLGATFGGGGSDSLFGAHASTHLSRLTIGFATIFILITLSLAIITAHRPKSKSLVELNSMLSTSNKPAQIVTPATAKAAENKPQTKTVAKQQALKKEAPQKTEPKK